MVSNQKSPKNKVLENNSAPGSNIACHSLQEKTAILSPALLLFGVFEFPQKTHTEGVHKGSRVCSDAVKSLFRYRHMDSTNSKQKTSTSIFWPTKPLNEGHFWIITHQP